jgi:hypothetical protein
MEFFGQSLVEITVSVHLFHILVFMGTEALLSGSDLVPYVRAEALWYFGL